MSPEQATTLLDWWQEQSFDGKSLFALSAEGSLTLKESSLYPSREIAQLNLQNLSVTVATLQKKFDEAQLKIQELQEEWQQTEEKVKLHGKVQRYKEYLLKAKLIGNYESLLQVLIGFEQETKALHEDVVLKKEAIIKQLAILIDGGNFKAITEEIKVMNEAWKVMSNADYTRNDKLWKQFESLKNDFFEKKKAHFANQEKDYINNLDYKMELVEKARKWSVSENWKEATSFFNACIEEWKKIGPTMYEKNESLWTELMQLKTDFFNRKKDNYAKIEKEQTENLTKKLALIDQAIALQQDTNWNETTQKMQDLTEQWKQIGRVPSEKSDEIWNAFSAAKDIFFAAKRAHFDEFKITLEDNLIKKETIVNRALSLKDSSDWRAATDEFLELMESWKKTGPAPRQKNEELWELFINAKKTFFERKDADRERRKKAAIAYADKRKEQQVEFLKQLKEELADEEAKQIEFSASLQNLEDGPKKEQLKEHLTNLIEEGKRLIEKKKQLIAKTEQEQQAAGKE
jgi:hypothetical protein